MREIILLALKLIDTFYYEYKKRSREKKIEKIINSSDDAWSARFGRLQSSTQTEVSERTSDSTTPADQ